MEACFECGGIGKIGTNKFYSDMQYFCFVCQNYWRFNKRSRRYKRDFWYQGGVDDVVQGELF